MALPQDPKKRPREHPRNSVQSQFRSPAELRAFFSSKENRERYKDIVEVEGGSGFAVKDQLLVKMDALKVSQEEGPVTYSSTEDVKRIFEQSGIRILRNGQRPLDVSVLTDCSCMDGLVFLLKGEGIHTLVSESFTIEGSTPPPYDPFPKIRSCPNYILPSSWIDDSSSNVTPLDLSSYQNSWNATRQVKDHAIVAILDTGIEDNKQQLPLWYKRENDPCSGSKLFEQSGWNFGNFQPLVNSFAGNQPLDDNVYRHGTKIAHIIHQLSPQDTAIIVLKAFDHFGIGTLQGVLCSLSYARKNKANFINASFGFYGEEIPLLTEAIEELKKEDILLVTAAGNHTDIDGFPNNISILNAYPACYSLRFTNVVSVTTLKCTHKESLDCCDNWIKRLIRSFKSFFSLTPCMIVPHENYSSEYVNVGILTTDGTFTNSYSVQSEPSRIEGSSFATPYFLGMAAARFKQIQNARRNNDTSPLKDLYFNHIPHDQHWEVSPYVRAGRFIKI